MSHGAVFQRQRVKGAQIVCTALEWYIEKEQFEEVEGGRKWHSNTGG